MDILNVQSLISQEKIVGSSDINPNNSYLVVGVWQDGNRKSGSANNAYPSYAIPLSELGGGNVTWGSITGLLSNQLDLQAALNNKYDISNPAGYITSAALSPYLTIVSAASTYATNASLSVKTLGTTLYSANPAAGPTFNTVNGIFLGLNAGNGIVGTNMIAIGGNAGFNATNNSTGSSVFLGASAGSSTNGCYQSNMIGNVAGANSSNNWGSNFIGYFAGNGSTSCSRSEFYGWEAGKTANGCYQSIFLGLDAGKNSVSCRYSFFLGGGAGDGANNCYSAVFIGSIAGKQAVNSSFATFVGDAAGWLANNAQYTTAVGANAGQSSSAVNGAFLGVNSGRSSGGTNNAGIGNGAAFGNQGSTVTALGSGTLQSNTASNVTAIGNGAGSGNGIPNVMILASSQLQPYPDVATAQAGLAATGTLIAGVTYLFYNTTLGCIGVVRI